MIMQLNVANKAALVPTMWQVDHGFAAVVNMTVKDHVFDLPVAKVDLDTLEPDVVAAHNQLQPRKLAILMTDIDRIVIVDETDMAVPQPYPLVPVGDGGRPRARFVLLAPQLGERFAAEIGRGGSAVRRLE